jgi:hypothetical protein
MEQKKAKLFHILKIAYYCLGFPIFFLAVLSLAMQNYGHVPFMGPASGLFIALKRVFTSPAMYAIWIALALWAATVIVQIICNYLVKNRSTRVVIVMASMLVILLLPMFIIDGVYTAKLDNLAETAPEGVVVKDYKTHLSYYRTQTSNGTNPDGSSMKVSYTDEIKKQMLQFCTVYNLPYHGAMYQSTAGSFENEGLRYDDFGFDYNEDGVIDNYDHILIKTPTGNKPYGTFWRDEIVLTSMSGKTTKTYKGNYYCVKYIQQVSPDSKENVDCYVWYLGDKATLEETDGHYGRAYYNKNGMLADGYIFSVEVALNILEEYYQAEEDMKALFKATGYTGTEAELRAQIQADAMARLEDRYTGANATEAEKELWAREISYAEGHSLTIAELNSVLAELGGVLGSASLVKELLPVLGMVGYDEITLGAALDMVLGGTLPETLAFLKANLSDLVNVTIQITTDPTLTLIVKNIPNRTEDLIIAIDDTLSTATIKGLLDEIGISNGMLAEVLTLVGFTAKADDNSLVGMENMLAGILETLYWYRSPILEPEYNFYVDTTLNPEVLAEKAMMDYQAAFAKFKRAEYEGSFHGSLSGSQLLGMALGDGTHATSEGLQNLQAVQQLKTDLSFIPEMYSVLIVRDMLMMFAGIIIFFTMMSYIAAEKEMLWATGQVAPKQAGILARLFKKNKKEENVNEEMVEEVPEVVEENNVEEDATEIATEIEDVEAVECPEEVDENNGEVE